jgi:hypothetical protein
LYRRLTYHFPFFFSWGRARIIGKMGFGIGLFWY